MVGLGNSSVLFPMKRQWVINEEITKYSTHPEIHLLSHEHWHHKNQYWRWTLNQLPPVPWVHRLPTASLMTTRLMKALPTHAHELTASSDHVKEMFTCQRWWMCFTLEICPYIIVESINWFCLKNFLMRWMKSPWKFNLTHTFLTN